jgi:hypothetical protein
MFLRTLTLTAVAGLHVAASAQVAGQSSPRNPQQAVKLSAVIATFLADSGVRTRGLEWSTGSALPIRWESPGPQPQRDASARSRGLVLSRTGSFIATIGDSVRLATTITVGGTSVGLAQVALFIPSMDVTTRSGGFFLTREMVEEALKHEGLTLQPLKCKRETEGASFGNLIDAVKAPGKTASGLWWYWQSPRQEMELSLTILYRRVDMNAVECFSG